MKSNYYVELENELCVLLELSYEGSKSYKEWEEVAYSILIKLDFTEIAHVLRILDLIKWHE